MSRIGRQPILLPPKVKVEISGDKVQVDGPKGRLHQNLPAGVSVAVLEQTITITRRDDEVQSKAFHGLTRALINNMVRGVSEGYSKKLEIHGVGFKAAIKGKQLDLSLGYSHPILFNIPEQIKITVDENTKLTVEGPDKQLVGQVAAAIRNYYPPEPYKGKGVRYHGEHITRKEGKTVQ
jgi:large subunit ribosomal protein L6